MIDRRGSRRKNQQNYSHAHKSQGNLQILNLVQLRSILKTVYYEIKHSIEELRAAKFGKVFVSIIATSRHEIPPRTMFTNGFREIYSWRSDDCCDPRRSTVCINCACRFLSSILSVFFATLPPPCPRNIWKEEARKAKMRIADYALNKHRQRRRQWQRRALEALVLNLADVLVLGAMNRAIQEHGNVKKLLTRTKHIVGVTFNINIYSDQECLSEYWFKRADIGVVAFLCDFPGVTSWNGYFCNDITATWIMLQRWATTTLSPRHGR